VTFLISVPYNYSYLLIYLSEKFLVDDIYGSSINNTYKLKFVLDDRECYRDIQSKILSAIMTVK